MTFLQGVELTATIFGILFVVLRMRQSMWCWPVGLLYIFPSIYLFYEWKLYSDLILQVIYIGTTFYGWWYWSRGKMSLEQESVPITNLSKKMILICGGIVLLGVGLIGTLMGKLTDASYPYPDALVLVVSLVAEILAARKIYQNWHFWIVVNCTGLVLILLKGGSIYAFLYLIFLGLSIAGLIEWRKQVLAK